MGDVFGCSNYNSFFIKGSLLRASKSTSLVSNKSIIGVRRNANNGMMAAVPFNLNPDYTKVF
jgi:hypothetical protein